jgi:1-acyl-sn-glycerol-3-phosphate acyltransferase
VLYDLIARLLVPTAWWGRLRVEGIDRVPERGGVLLVPNHDSQWDPVLIGVALRRRRKLRFLARADLWRIPGLAPIMNALRQIPLERGAGDAAALERAVDALCDGEAVCVFPEGRLSRGLRLPARSGVGRLAEAVPGTTIVLCAIAGATDYVRFPRRPRVTLAFFEPEGGQRRDGEEPPALAGRLLAELRGRVAPVPAGRRPERDTSPDRTEDGP